MYGHYTGFLVGSSVNASLTLSTLDRLSQVVDDRERLGWGEPICCHDAEFEYAHCKIEDHHAAWGTFTY